MLLLAACLGGVVYSFSIFDEYGRLNDDQLGWEGAGAYLVYLWLNYWLANIIQAKQVDVLLATGCKSSFDIFFVASRYIFFLLVFTMGYFILLVVYLLWVSDRIMCRIMSGLIVGVFLAELAYRVYKTVGMKNT